MAATLGPLDDALLLKPAFEGKRVTVDREAATARIGGGAIWDEVVGEVAANGLTVMHGSSPTVGAIGYLLGGGLSFYGRAHGFAANRIRSFEIVTSDGEVRRADREENPDLFWALRGGGGGIGVVTEVEIELLPVTEVFAGTSFWPVAEAPGLLRIWGEWTTTAPDSVTSTFRILRLPPLEQIPEPIRGVPVACVDGVALDDEAGAGLAGLFGECAEPLMGGWGRQPSAAVARLHGDPEDPLPAIGDAILLDALDAGARERFISAAGGDSGSSLVVAEIRHLGGSLGRLEDDGGVLSHLDAEFMLFGTGVAFDPDSARATKNDLDRLLTAMQPDRNERRFYSFSEGGYSPEDCFGPESAAKLESIRDRYDPDRLFMAPYEGTGG